MNNRDEAITFLVAVALVFLVLGGLIFQWTWMKAVVTVCALLVIVGFVGFLCVMIGCAIYTAITGKSSW
jgi:hypothetical protein